MASGGDLLTAHCAEPCIHTWGTHNLHSVTSQKKVTKCNWPWYTASFTHHLDFRGQFKQHLAVLLKIKTHSTISSTKASILQFYFSRRSTHRVVSVQPGDLST